MTKIAMTLLGIVVCVNIANAELQSFDLVDSWTAAVPGPISTMDFTGFPDDMVVDEQYAHLGAHFTTFDVISGPSLDGFPNDGWGLSGFEEIVIEFDWPQSWIASSTPGAFQIMLYLDDDLVGTSPNYWPMDGPTFGGVISDVPFDKVVLHDPFDDHVHSDDILFGGYPVPAPAGFVLFALAGIESRGRWRLSKMADTSGAAVTPGIPRFP